jgi:hypothetical protein
MVSWARFDVKRASIRLAEICVQYSIFGIFTQITE